MIPGGSKKFKRQAVYDRIELRQHETSAQQLSGELAVGNAATIDIEFIETAPQNIPVERVKRPLVETIV